MANKFFDKILKNKYFIIINFMVYLFLIIFFIIKIYANTDTETDTNTYTVTNVEEKLFSTISNISEKSTFYTNEIIEFDYKNAKMYFNKLDYKGDNSDEFYNYTIPIDGNNISVSYVKDSRNLYYKTTKDYTNLPKSTIYIKTDIENLVVSIPTVYEKNRKLDTIQTQKDYEIPITITKNDDKFYINYSFPKNDEYLSEFYYLKSNEPLFDFDRRYATFFVSNEIANRFRVLEDGFYQKSHADYYPTGEGNYFRTSANYVAKSYITNNNILEDKIELLDYLGYAFAYVTNKQINENGYFTTNSISQWLYFDFQIENGFFDTRFNADNAEMNLALLKRYPEDFVEDTLYEYSDFLLEYIQNHSYKTANGVLVEDYYNPKGGLKTHSSLNHILANLNVLLSLYDIDKDEKYLNSAMLMLRGIEDTKDEWILDDGNLLYALEYNGIHNNIVDYPYLTYNDLFICKKRLEKLGIKSQAIDELMASKLSYMKNNNISGYYEKYYE